MKGRWWITLGLAAVALIGTVLLIAEANSDPITHANFLKINQAGVTEAEVIAVLGRPADEIVYTPSKGIPGLLGLVSVKIWEGRRTTIRLGFAEGDTIFPAFSCFEEEETLIEKLRHWWKGHGAFGRKSTCI